MEKLKHYLFCGLSFACYDSKGAKYEKQYIPIVGASFNRDAIVKWLSLLHSFIQ